MFHPEGLMHRKINIWIALGVLTVITISAAFALSARAVSGFYFGGKIISHTLFCSNAVPVPGQCPGTICPCHACGCVKAPCVPPAPAWTQVLFTPVRNSQTSVICPAVGFTNYRGGLPKPGAFLIGSGANPYTLYIVGVSSK